MQEDDMLRTVGIYTDYVDTLDFSLEPKDNDFMIKVCSYSGKFYTRTFFLFEIIW